MTLVGITIPPVDEHRWWAPDGTPLAENPIPQAGEGILHRGYDDDLYRRLVFRFTSAPRREASSITARWMVEGSLTRASAITSTVTYSTIDICRASDRRFTQTSTIFLGVAESPWTTQQITHCKDGGYTNTMTPDPSHAVSVRSLRAYPQDITCQVTVTYPYALGEQEDIRLLAFDTGGKCHTASGISGDAFSPANPPAMRTINFNFNDVAPEQVAKVQFETRPYTWLKFTDVALEPTAQ